MFFSVDCETPEVPECFEEQEQDDQGNEEGEDEEHAAYGLLGAEGYGQVQWPDEQYRDITGKNPQVQVDAILCLD